MSSTSTIIPSHDIIQSNPNIPIPMNSEHWRGHKSRKPDIELQVPASFRTFNPKKTTFPCTKFSGLFFGNTTDPNKQFGTKKIENFDVSRFK